MSAAPAGKAAADVFVRATRAFSWRHNGGLFLNHYANQEVIGGDAMRELLAAKCPFVTLLGEEPAATCPACGGPMTADAIRAGVLVVERAHVVLTPLRRMLDIVHVDLRPGDLVELRQAPHAAAQIVREATPGSVQEANITIFQSQCPRCRGVGLFAVKAS